MAHLKWYITVDYSANSEAKGCAMGRTEFPPLDL